MLIQVNTDSHTPGTAELTVHVQTLVEDKLSRFADRITRAEVHFTDVNSSTKAGGNDKRCMIEVRMAGMDPISTTDQASTHDQALRGAANKMQNKIETILGKLGRG
jgi:ribosome-associated translation inhibitor RaiA